MITPQERAVEAAIERIDHYDEGPPGTHAYCDSGDALADAKVVADAYLERDREYHALAGLVREIGERHGFHWEPDCSPRSMLAKLSGEIEILRRDRDMLLELRDER